MANDQKNVLHNWEAVAGTDSATDTLGELLRVGGLGSAAAMRSLALSFPDLDGLCLADMEAVAALPGVGKLRAELIVAALAFADQALRRATVVRGQVYSSDELGKQLVRRFAGLHQEQLLVYYLDIKNQIIYEETQSAGSMEASMSDQRLIMRRALVVGASRFILAHNHPSGDVAPSSHDEDVTERLSMTGHLMGVELIDHIIVGKEDYMSFRESGLI
ncbi:JAB domain-containing protein [Lacticaseibacillus zhaodongensis]|uniref:JAB domain-containing protein n=1 Tax=Lacticaseibacillus zhaodongensis TaxID=2668065 RepID=UPI0012D36E7E|nr:JAB domain-containing protein [Lacticaseibacillus zhaodongensis]